MDANKIFADTYYAVYGGETNGFPYPYNQSYMYKGNMVGSDAEVAAYMNGLNNAHFHCFKGV